MPKHYALYKLLREAALKLWRFAARTCLTRSVHLEWVEPGKSQIHGLKAGSEQGSAGNLRQRRAIELLLRGSLECAPTSIRLILSRSSTLFLITSNFKVCSLQTSLCNHSSSCPYSIARVPARFRTLSPPPTHLGFLFEEEPSHVPSAWQILKSSPVRSLYLSSYHDLLRTTESSPLWHNLAEDETCQLFLHPASLCTDDDV